MPNPPGPTRAQSDTQHNTIIPLPPPAAAAASAAAAARAVENTQATLLGH
jgi:hypothetical protein